jgi:hypothetical protein
VLPGYNDLGTGMPLQNRVAQGPKRRSGTMASGSGWRTQKAAPPRTTALCWRESRLCPATASEQQAAQGEEAKRGGLGDSGQEPVELASVVILVLANKLAA